LQLTRSPSASDTTQLLDWGIIWSFWQIFSSNVPNFSAAVPTCLKAVYVICRNKNLPVVGFVDGSSDDATVGRIAAFRKGIGEMDMPKAAACQSE
jgi:hypothetical protein